MITVVTELFLDDAWVDVSSYVRQAPGHAITFGVQAESATADPATCTLVANNTDGRFTPRNTAGAYYPDLRRNTPLRVTADGTVRFFGEVSEFPPRWEASGRVVWAPLVVSGILRRLQRAKSLQPTLTSAVLDLATRNGDITGYWPIEDPPGSTALASALPDGTSGSIGGTPDLGAVDLGAGTHAVATWGGGSAYFTPAAATSTEFTAGFYVRLPTSGLTGGEELFRVNTAGTAASWRVLYSPSTGGGLFLQVIDTGGVEVLVSGAFTGQDGTSFYVKIEGTQDGADVDWAFSVTSIGTFLGTIASRTVGAPQFALIGAGTIAVPADAPVAIGHVVLGDSNTALFAASFDDGIEGYAGESVNTRMARLETQTGVSITVFDAGANTIEHGAQPDGTLLEVLRATEKADAGGILRDSLTTLGLVYITRDARYNDNQPLLTLDYGAGELTPPIEPTDDDQQLRNDVKVNRISGSSARATLASGALSTADYPDGVGPYPFEDSYAVYSDAQLPYLAGWILALGTIDETRFPAVTVDLVKNPHLVTDTEALRPGSRLRIENLPAYAGATDVDLQVIGWRENLSATHRTITFVCTPGSIWGPGGAAGGFLELDDLVFGELDVNRLAY